MLWTLAADPETPSSFATLFHSIARESLVLGAFLIFTIITYLITRRLGLPALRIYREAAALQNAVASSFKAAARTHRRAIRENVALSKSLAEITNRLATTLSTLHPEPSKA